MADQSDVSDDWKQCSDLTIYEAAFWVRLKLDPRKHAHRCEVDDAEYINFMQHPGGYAAVIEKCDVILSAVRSGIIRTTKEALTLDGSLDFYQTYISKSDWLVWCENNGLHDLLVRFGYRQSASVSIPPSNAMDEGGEPISASMNNAKHGQPELERKYRGCKRHIVLHWSEIRKEYGSAADGHQVLRYFKKVLDAAEMPKLKTVQNHLSTLRKEKAIP